MKEWRSATRKRFILGRSAFLTIELLAKFGFDHRTSKPGIFNHPTIKIVHFWPSNGFQGGFADVDIMSPCRVRWAHTSTPSLSSLFSPHPQLSVVGRRRLSHLTVIGSHPAPAPPLHWPFSCLRASPTSVVVLPLRLPSVLPPPFISTKHPIATDKIRQAPAISVK
jgi:hypothetical protein